MENLPGDYVAGFVDGEGCFYLTYRSEIKHKRAGAPKYFRWTPYFAIVLRKDDIEMAPDVVREMLETSILGMVPEDDSVRKSISVKNAVIHSHPKSKASRAYKEIAANLLKIKYDSDKDKKNPWKRFFEWLGMD